MNNHNTKNCRAHLKCTYCNGKGHTYDYCRRRKTATAGGQTRSKANHVAPQNNSKEALPDFPFSREECHQLLSQLLTKTNHKEIQKQIQTPASWFFHVQTLEHGIVPQLFHHKASQTTDSDTTAPGQVQSQVLT